jgi:uncharacterized protein (DUF1684 family)
VTEFDPAAHRAEIEGWRAGREARLRSPDGWVALVALIWLEPGRWSVGSGPDRDIVLPGSNVPVDLGVLEVGTAQARLTASPGQVVTVGGQLANQVELLPDDPGPPTVFIVGSIRAHLVIRHGRLGLRIRDAAAPALATFTGLRYYPIDPAWRIVATFEPAAPDAMLGVPDVLGGIDDIGLRGWVTFPVGGAEQRLAAVDGGDGELWLIFGDATNAGETYPGGRFLYTGPPQPDGTVVIDFNRTYNPPCAFSPFATCPLPPPGNRLTVRIPAGELAYP